MARTCCCVISPITCTLTLPPCFHPLLVLAFPYFCLFFSHSVGPLLLFIWFLIEKLCKALGAGAHLFFWICLPNLFWFLQRELHSISFRTFYLARPGLAKWANSEDFNRSALFVVFGHGTGQAPEQCNNLGPQTSHLRWFTEPTPSPAAMLNKSQDHKQVPGNVFSFLIQKCFLFCWILGQRPTHVPPRPSYSHALRYTQLSRKLSIRKKVPNKKWMLSEKRLWRNTKVP